MELANDPLFQWMAQFAYQPNLIYLAVICMMLASGFGLPIPEEVTILSVGLLAYMGQHPDQYPPPYPGAPVLKVHTAMFVTFLAVYATDFLVYSIGRIGGRRLMKVGIFKRMFPEGLVIRLEDWVHRYGAWACGIFRFTPGIRFPGHLFCGMFRFSIWKFAAIDGMAALISVPTQIYLVAVYGESILKVMKQFKLILFAVILTAVAFLLIRHWIRRSKPAQ